ncbi:MAG: threonine--tRNA ligase [Pseudomonadota bacterium]|jgi:threonyl-tRNA synthetase|nr:threonine--tRNA ligase [Alphaproteobacteria bacterium]
MITIRLKDGSEKVFEKIPTGEEIAFSISPRLAKDAVAIRVNGDLKDLNQPVQNGAQIEIITKSSDEGLEVIRHDTAHLFAQAIKELYPDTQITIGPAIENGFYYDIYPKKSLSIDDLPAIEKRMHDIVDQDIAIVREEWNRDDAIPFFKDMGEHFKAEIIEGIPQGETISLYRQGQFIDLCRGPHLPTTKRVGHAFKLMKLAGAYWRGDHRNVMLQRIYGTAWATQQQLDEYLHMLEEAEKRDHRKLGAELGLFHMQEEATGSVFWHPKGWTIYRNLENFVRKRIEKANYVEVRTPHLVDRSLWEASGHWDKFGTNMYSVQADEDKVLAIKPMNCPCHVQIFKQGLKSYRDLPLRMAEFGACHRNEPSGSLHGIMRVRSFVQDDAHIFCTPDQIISETKSFCDLLKGMYKDLGFDDFKVKFSDRPEVRAGTDELWDKAEAALKEATLAAGIEYSLNPGEGAFYGPKLEFVLKDCIGREWQCGTLQVDYCLPERLDATYVGEDGQKHHPVMLHRAVLGSLERFVGVLIEHYAGKFPLWLAPVQVVVASITTEANDYAQDLLNQLREKGIRAELDTRNEKISYKIREHSLQKIPYVYVVGKREAEEKTVAIRKLGGEQQTVMTFSQALQDIYAEANTVEY